MMTCDQEVFDRARAVVQHMYRAHAPPERSRSGTGESCSNRRRSAPMPLKAYGVLKGQAIDARREDNQSSPHYQVHIRAGATHYRLAVNVKSVATPSELMFLVNDAFQHPITAHLEDLAEG